MALRTEMPLLSRTTSRGPALRASSRRFDFRARLLPLLLCLCLLSADGLRAGEPAPPALVEPQAAESETAAPAIRIRPRNYDPRDPEAYVRLQGEPAPGHVAEGPRWNAPNPLFQRSSGFVLPTVVRAADPHPGTRPPSPEVIYLGRSVQGNPLLLYVFGHTGQPLFVFGAIHGSEPNSGVVASRLLEHLLAHPEAYAGNRVAILPVANPDGLASQSRTNKHDIDVNRNFPAANWRVGSRGATYGGEKAGSEPETQAIMQAVELLQPRCIISLHAITRGRQCNNYDGPAAAWAELLKTKNGYPVKASIGYPTPGSFGSWSGTDRQIPTITLELPHDQPGEESWNVQREALLTVIRTPQPEAVGE